LSLILESWKKEKSQPNLVCLGGSEKDLISFFVACDGLLLPINSQNSTEAIDCLFKSHYVFGTQYDKNLVGLWTFIQVFIYKLEVEKTVLSRTVKEVFVQLQKFI
jgi:hypothetical protein